MNSKKIVSFLQLMVSGLVLYLASCVIYAPSAHASSIPGCDNGNAPVASGAWNRSEDRAACYLQHKRACPQGALWMNTSENRTVRINQELTSMHQEVIKNYSDRKSVV